MTDNAPEPRFWLMPCDDPEGRPFGIVDETGGGIIAYAVNEDLGEFIDEALNALNDLGLLGPLPVAKESK